MMRSGTQEEEKYDKNSKRLLRIADFSAKLYKSDVVDSPEHKTNNKLLLKN